MNTQIVSAITYMDIIAMSEDFVSLDISVNETGWARWCNGELTYGAYKIEAPSDDPVARRREFRAFLQNIFGQHHFGVVFIEDVIGGVNHETNKILYQLNPITDDLKGDGLISVDRIYREDNKVWKSYLKKASNYKSKYIAEKDDKQIIRDCLYNLGFGDQKVGVIKEGSYDAVGMAVGLIFKEKVLKVGKKNVKIKKDISKAYKLEQYSDYYAALDRANVLNDEIVEVDLMKTRKDLKQGFKSFIMDYDDDSKIFLISILTCKVGAIALEKDFNLSYETSYILAYLPRTRKKKK